jgi:hypothetical protein
MRRFSCCLLLLLACTGALFAQSVPLNLGGGSYMDRATEQRRVITSYCRLDFEGARLTPDGWQRMHDLAVNRENPDFNVVFIVARYQVENNPQPAYDVAVHYSLIGRYEEGLGYTPMSGTKTASFDTQSKGGEVRIKEIDPKSPFAGRKATVEWLKRKLADTNSTANRDQIQAAIKALEPEPKPAVPAKP